MQEADSERRIKILRGEEVNPLPAPLGKEANVKRERHDGSGRETKRRRIAGEDETEREMRFAQEERALLPTKSEMQMTSKKSGDAPLTDNQGHINLFPSEVPIHKSTKNAEVEAEKVKKKRELEDQYTMRFSNAAGFKHAIGQKPWYQQVGDGRDTQEAEEMPSKDVWGNEDPRRKEREKMRIVADDPLAAMRNGAAGVREAERQKTKWREEKTRDIRALEEDERRRERKRRRRHEEDDFEGFSLDNPGRPESRRHRHHRDGETSSKQSYQHRSHSRERDRHGSRRHRHRSPDGVPKDGKRSGWEAVSGTKYSSQYVHT